MPTPIDGPTEFSKRLWRKEGPLKQLLDLVAEQIAQQLRSQSAHESSVRSHGARDQATTKRRANTQGADRQGRPR